MTDQLAFPFAPEIQRKVRSRPWGGVGPDPEKRRQRQIEWRKNNRDKENAAKQRWRDKNPDKHHAQLARYYKNNRDQWRIKNRKWVLKQYNLTAAEFSALLEAQERRCAICQKRFDDLPTKVRNARIDHHHDSGRVRGLLCHSCNTGLGLFGDDPTQLRAAAEYIENRRIIAEAFHA